MIKFIRLDGRFAEFDIDGQIVRRQIADGVDQDGVDAHIDALAAGLTVERASGVIVDPHRSTVVADEVVQPAVSFGDVRPQLKTSRVAGEEILPPPPKEP